MTSVFLKPAVLDNLLTSMKFVLHGMGALRINLANNRNKVACLQDCVPACRSVSVCVLRLKAHFGDMK